MKTKKNDKINKKKKKHEENYKSRTPPPPEKYKIKKIKKEQPVRFEPKNFFAV